MRLHVVVADRDVVADHLADADVRESLGRHDDQVAGREGRPHAPREDGLGPVPAGVRQEAEQEQGEQGEPQGEAREQLASWLQRRSAGRRPVSCLRFERARDYLLVAVRCVPVKA